MVCEYFMGDPQRSKLKAAFFAASNGIFCIRPMFFLRSTALQCHANSNCIK